MFEADIYKDKRDLLYEYVENHRLVNTKRKNRKPMSPESLAIRIDQRFELELELENYEGINITKTSIGRVVWIQFSIKEISGEVVRQGFTDFVENLKNEENKSQKEVDLKNSDRTKFPNKRTISSFLFVSEDTIRNYVTKETYTDDTLNILSLFLGYYGFMGFVEDLEFVKKDPQDRVETRGAKTQPTHLEGYPKELTKPPTYDSKNFVGRVGELEVLHRKLISSKFLSLNGIGGIGKTAFVLKYLQEEKAKHFAHICWISIKETWRQSILANQSLISNLNLEFTKDDKSDFRYEMIINRLNTLNKKSLLIIDNVYIGFEEEIPALPNNEWTILMIGRSPIEDFENITLNPLESWEAIELFERWHKREYIPLELQQLLNEVGSHTLAIEVIAKTLQRSPKASQIKDVLIKIRASELDELTWQATVRLSLSKESSTIYGHLLKVFVFSKLTEEQNWILMHLSLLPFSHFSWEHMAQFLNTTQYDSEVLHHFFIELVEEGWIQSENYIDGHIHKIVKEIAFIILDPEFQKCILCIESVSDFLKLHMDNLGRHSEKIYSVLELAKGILNVFPVENRIQVNLCHSVSLIVGNTYGDEKLAKKYLNWGLESAPYILENDSSDLADIYSLKAVFLRIEKLYEDALDFETKALSIWEKLNMVQLIATSLILIGKIYSEKGESKKAITKLKHALRFIRANKGSPSLEESFALEYLGYEFGIVGKYEKGIDHLERAMIIIWATAGPESLPLIDVYASLSLLYFEAANLEESTFWKSCELALVEKFFDSSNPRISRSYLDYGQLLLLTEQWSLAWGWFSKALEAAEHANSFDYYQVCLTKLLTVSKRANKTSETIILINRLIVHPRCSEMFFPHKIPYIFLAIAHWDERNWEAFINALQVITPYANEEEDTSEDEEIFTAGYACFACIKLCGQPINKGDVFASIQLIERAKEIIDERINTKMPQLSHDVYQCLASLYGLQGNELLAEEFLLQARNFML